MFCTHCGADLETHDCYCYKCGAATGNVPRRPAPAPLRRSMTDKKIAGVCGGFATYAEMDSTLVRLLWLLLTFGLPPVGLLGYIAAWIIMPPEPREVAPVPAQPVTPPMTAG